MDRLYVYEGPVMIFNGCVLNHWEAETLASSEKKARSNFIYQYKIKNGLEPGSKVTLPGKIKEVIKYDRVSV